MGVYYRSNIHLARAEELLNQSRADQAIQEVTQHLAEDPDDPAGHVVMARAEALRDNLKEALTWADRAVHLAPDFAYSHYIRAFVLARMNKTKDAEQAALEALRIDAFQASFYAMLGQIRGQRSDWKGAVEAAEAGLALDASHTGCANIRAMALLRQGQKDNAEAAIQSALANDPEDARSHTNQGWICLNRGERDRALEHFREALRLDPTMDMAREGVLEALRTKYPIYRVMFSYYQWMSRFSGPMQLAIILGAFMGQRVLSAIFSKYPGAGPVVIPLLILYVLFVFLSWTGRSTFDVLLRFNPLGRLALTRNQTVASSWVAVCLLSGIVSLGVIFATGYGCPVMAAVCFVLLAIPASRVAVLKGDARLWNGIVAGLYVATAGLEISGVLLHDPAWVTRVLNLFVMGFVGFTWISGAVRSRS